jgi:hypothetical protein
MNLLKTIIERLNQRVEVANIFDKQFGLCELNANGNEKAWVHYIGNGQAEVVTNFDAKQGTLFWAKRGKVTVVKTDAFRVSGCKQLYITSFPLTAYAVVRKSHLPCDSEDAQDWLASRIYKITSGTDPVFKQAIGVINYEVIPSGYINEIKTLTANYEWACVSVDFDIQVITTTEDGCYDICQTGDIPLPDLPACTPCLTEVAVDGVTIIGNGTAADPLVAVGGGGGAISVEDEGIEVTPVATTLNFTGAGVTASLTSPGVVEVNVPGGGGGGVTSVSGTAPIASSGGATPAISISQASTSTDGYLSQTDWDTFNNKFNVPTGLVTDYLDGLGAPTPFPAIPTGTVTSVDLSMPAAFSVSGNPVTTSGTLAVTAAGVATQYIRGDGQLANFPTSGGGGASVNYYLNGSVSQGTFGGVAMREINKVPVIGAGTDFTINADGYIQSFITDANDPNQLEIPAGNWTFETYFSASSSGGSPSFYIELYKWDGAALTLIASSSATPEGITSGTTIDLYITTLAIPQTALLATDRLAVRIYVTHSGRTITLHTEDNHLSQIITTFSTGLTSLNGLTAQTQLLAVGTSGTDFAISSTTATHTFNLPTASAANRGALSAADWTAFDAKQAAITPAALTKVDDTNVTLTLGGTPATALLQAASITAGWSGTLADARIASAATWNAKQDAITLTTTGTSGAATLTGATLNIPQYSGGGGSALKSTTDTAGYSLTANTAVYTQFIAANTYGINDILRVTYRTRKTGVLGTQTLRIYVNVTADLVGTPILIGGFASAGAISFLVNQMVRHLAIKSSTNNTEVYFATGLGISTDYGLYNAVTTCAIDWTTNKYFVFAIQQTNALDVNYGSMYLIEKL